MRSLKNVNIHSGMLIINSKLLILFISALFAFTYFVALDITQFDDPDLLERYHSLTEELRCLVCQNETIAGSSAPLAVDLRYQVASQIKAGQTDDQIRAYMTERYGEFILYRPPLSGVTKLLWIAPLVLLLLSGFIFILVLNKRNKMLDDEDLE